VIPAADTFEFLFLAAVALAAIICAAVCLGAAVTALAAHKRARGQLAARRLCGLRRERP
jgi:hypothetical protein